MSNDFLANNLIVYIDEDIIFFYFVNRQLWINLVS